MGGTDFDGNGEGRAPRFGFLSGRCPKAAIRQIEPLLQEVRSVIAGPKGRRARCPPSLSGARPMRLTPPGNYLLHLIEKQLPAAVPGLLLKRRMTRQTAACSRPRQNHITSMN